MKEIFLLKLGEIVLKGANKRHRLISKPTKMKRKARGMTLLRACDFFAFRNVFKNIVQIFFNQSFRRLKLDAEVDRRQVGSDTGLDALRRRRNVS